MAAAQKKLSSHFFLQFCVLTRVSFRIFVKGGGGGGGKRDNCRVKGGTKTILFSIREE